ncbi:glycosyl transferase, group 2 family protein [Lachnospiraceae bacterium KM106-2]|nr:glycosyl transferase, group 2 family protein [Lachnospiraceae bacterium KM106-2]
MIVKNEERVLDRCLASIAPLMDEIIIVDTGSTDKTMEIARKYTNQVYEYEWNDDFAAARNYSLSLATKEYIYVADADEVLDEENQKCFQELKQAMLPEIEIIQMKYGNQLEFGSVYNFDEEYRPKLFKRIREFQYVNPIHEIIQVDPVIYDSEVVITHRPHESHAQRDFTLFQKLIHKGEHLSAHLINMYAKELYISGTDSDFIQAYEYFRGVLSDPSRTKNEMDDARCIVVKAARIKKDIETFFGTALAAVAESPCSEICYELGEYYQEKKNKMEARKWYEFAAFQTNSSLNIHYSDDFPKQRLESL